MKGVEVEDREIFVRVEEKRSIEKFRENLAAVFFAVSDWNLQGDLGVLDELDSGWGPVSFRGAFEVFHSLDKEAKKRATDTIVEIKRLFKDGEGYAALLKIHADISDFQNFADDFNDIGYAIAHAVSHTPGIRYVKGYFEYLITRDFEYVDMSTEIEIKREKELFTVSINHTEEPDEGSRDTWGSSYVIEAT